MSPAVVLGVVGAMLAVVLGLVLVGGIRPCRRQCLLLDGRRLDRLPLGLRRRIEDLVRRGRCLGRLLLALGGQHAECGAPLEVVRLALLDGAFGKIGAGWPLGLGVGHVGAAAGLGYQLGPRVGPRAEGVEALGDAFQHPGVAAAARRPLGGQIAEGDGPVEAGLPTGEHAPFLHLARALCGRVLEPLAGIEQEVLEVGAHARRNVLEALARLAAAGGAEAGKIVLGGLHVPVSAAVAVAQRAGLEDHLIERVIPAYAELLAVPHVLDGNALEAGTEIGVAALQVFDETAGRHARRHRVLGAAPDVGHGARGGLLKRD